jgi:hypothetical protein
MNGMLLNNLKTPTQIFEDEGILFYPGLITPAEAKRLREACDYVMAQFREELERTRPEVCGEVYNMRHLNDTRWHRDTREHFRVIMETVADPRCLGPVEQIFQGPSLFRSTSYYFNPREGNRDGDWHRDHQFVFDSEEKVREYISQPRDITTEARNGIQLQIALVETEDIEYVPFSAKRYDSPEEYYIRCADDRSHNREGGMPNAMRIHQKPGDAIIFNSAGLHRGRYHADIPRRTLLLTYTARQTELHDFFSKQPWMLEADYFDGLSLRTRAYFQDYIDVYGHTWSAADRPMSNA